MPESPQSYTASEVEVLPSYSSDEVEVAAAPPKQYLPEVNKAVATVPKPTIPSEPAPAPVAPISRPNPKLITARPGIEAGEKIATDVSNVGTAGRELATTQPSRPLPAPVLARSGQVPYAPENPEQQRREAVLARGTASAFNLAMPAMLPSAVAAPLPAAGAVAAGYLASKGTRFAAKQLGASPEMQDLAEQMGWLITPAGLIDPKTGIEVAPDSLKAAVTAFGGGTGVSVHVTPEEIRIRGGVGRFKGEKVIPRGAKAGPALEAPTIEAEPPFTREEISRAQEATNYAGPQQAEAYARQQRAAQRAVAVSGEAAAPPTAKGAESATPAAAAPSPEIQKPVAAPPKVRPPQTAPPQAGSAAAEATAPREMKASEVEIVGPTPESHAESEKAFQKNYPIDQAKELSPVEKEHWQKSAFGQEPEGDVGAKVRQRNPEPTRAEVKAAQAPKAPKVEFKQGDAVTLPDGRRAKVDYVAPADKAPVVRARTDDGEKVELTKQKEIEQLKPASKYRYGNTQANIHPQSEAGQALETARSRISESDLAGKGKDVDGNHVTVRYGIQGDDVKGIKEFLSKQAPFEASLGKTDKFPPSESSDNAAVIMAPIDAPELHRINAEIEKHGDFAKSNFPEFQPHATVAYVSPSKADRYVGMSVTAGKKFTVDKIAITDRNGNAEMVKLEGKSGDRQTEKAGSPVPEVEAQAKVAQKEKEPAGVPKAQGAGKAAAEVAKPATPPGATAPVAGVEKVSKAEATFEADVKKRAATLRATIAEMDKRLSAPAATFQDPKKNAAERDQRRADHQTLLEAREELQQIEHAHPHEVKPLDASKLPDKEKNKHAFQREYFTQSLQPVLDAWRAHLGDKFANAAKNGVKGKNPPADFPEGRILVNIPGDGHFKVINDPKVLTSVIRGAAQGFAKPSRDIPPKTRLVKFSAKPSEPAKWSYLKRMEEEANEAATPEEKQAAKDTIENILDFTPSSKSPEIGTTVEYQGERHIVIGKTDGNSARYTNLLLSDSPIGKIVQKWIDAGKPKEIGVKIDDIHDAEIEAPNLLIKPLAARENLAEAKGQTPSQGGLSAPEEPVPMSARSGERGFATPAAINPFEIAGALKDSYQSIAKDFIDKKLGIGDKYAKVKQYDPQIANTLHLVDNAPRYFREKAQSNLNKVLKGLNDDQIRLAHLMYDSDSYDDLKENHPDEYDKATQDPKVMAAVKAYEPLDKEIRADRKFLGWPIRKSLVIEKDPEPNTVDDNPWQVFNRKGTLVADFQTEGEAKAFIEQNATDEPHLKRTYPEHSKNPLPGDTGTGPFTGSFYADKGLRPPKMDKKTREMSAQYHYEHGRKDFSGYLESYAQAKTAVLKQKLFDELQSEATLWKAGTAQPPTIQYNGKEYVRPDIALKAKKGKTELPVYAIYDPSRGEKFLIKTPDWSTLTTGKPGIGPNDRYLAPKPVVDALENYDASRGGEGPGKLRKFFQEQIVGLFGPAVHVNNIVRHLGQAEGMGAFDPRSWKDITRIMLSGKLRERMQQGVDDSTIDMLVRRGAYTDWHDIGNMNAYIGGNFNPVNWVRTFGKGVLFDPKFLKGWGGLDPKARVVVADYLKEYAKGISEQEIADHVNAAFGDYNRANWTERQKQLAKFMLFPGWDYASAKWFLRHPFRVGVAGALVVLAINLALQRMGKIKGDEAYDFSYIHYGDRKYRPGVLSDALGQHVTQPMLSAAEAYWKGEDVATGAEQGALRGGGGLIGTLRPEIQWAAEQFFNRKFAGSASEIVKPEDKNIPGKILPNRDLEKRTIFTILKAFPAMQRFIAPDQTLDVRTGVGSILGVTNYKYGAEERLRTNAGRASGINQTLDELAKTDPEAAQKFVENPANAVYLAFHGDLSELTKDLKEIDDETSRVKMAGDLSQKERKEALQSLADTRIQLLQSAEALNEQLSLAKMTKAR